MNITKHQIYRLVNDDDVIARIEIVNGVTLLHNPMLVEVAFNNESKLEIRMMPYTIYANTIHAFQDIHILMVVDAPEKIIGIYNNLMLRKDELEELWSGDSEELIIENSNIETRILH